jgi:hypothetical protein
LADEQQNKHNPIFHYENGVPVFDDRRINNLEREQEEAKQRDAQYKDAQLKVNTWLMIYTGVLALCSVLAGGVSVWQAHITSQTIGEMQANRQQTKLDNAATIKAQQDIAEKALNSSQGDFNKSSQMAEQTFRDDQRAWVGAENTFVDQFDTTKPFMARIQFTNRGKTPARAVQVSTGFIHSPTFLDGPAPEHIAALRFQGRSIVAPQASQTVLADGFSRGNVRGGRSLPIEMASQHYNEIRQSTAFFYVFGQFRYVDTSDRTHVTKFCYFLHDVSASITDPPNWQLGYCNTYNEMD